MAKYMLYIHEYIQAYTKSTDSQPVLTILIGNDILGIGNVTVQQSYRPDGGVRCRSIKTFLRNHLFLRQEIFDFSGNFVSRKHLAI